MSRAAYDPARSTSRPTAAKGECALHGCLLNTWLDAMAKT